MPRFDYEGRNNVGKKMYGKLEAPSESIVAEQLIKIGIIPITITEFKEVKKKTIEEHLKLGFPTLQDMNFFCRQLHALTRSSVPLVRALKVLSDSVQNMYLKKALADIVKTVQEGQSLGAAMSAHTDIFPPILIALVKVGENTGNLDAVFEQAGVHFDREIDTRKRVTAAIRYPLMVIIVIALAMVVINVFVIPAFSNFFSQFRAQLPLPTLILVMVSEFTLRYWYWVVFAIFLVIGSVGYYIKTPAGRYEWDSLKLRIPVLGGILQRGILARFAHAFALCLRTGVPLLSAIDLMAETTNNVFVAEKILAMRNDIEHGESLTTAAHRTRMFTPLVLQMLMVGEEAGDIDRLLEDVAYYYEQELDYQVKRMGDYIEPILLSILGVMVLLLALGVYLPMWDLSRAAFGTQ